MRRNSCTARGPVQLAGRRHLHTEIAMSAHANWDLRFLALFDRSLQRYLKGDGQWADYFSPEETAWLASLGCKPREFYDFVEDNGDSGGDPAPATALLIAAVRRDYFHVIQKGKASDRELRPSDLPEREDASLGGIPWLRRILAKARAKLRGELHPDVMYGCGGDRLFFQRHDCHGADFLRVVWAAGDDDEKVLAWLKGDR